MLSQQYYILFIEDANGQKMVLCFPYRQLHMFHRNTRLLSFPMNLYSVLDVSFFDNILDIDTNIGIAVLGSLGGQLPSHALGILLLVDILDIFDIVFNIRISVLGSLGRGLLLLADIIDFDFDCDFNIDFNIGLALPWEPWRRTCGPAASSYGFISYCEVTFLQQI